MSLSMQALGTRLAEEIESFQTIYGVRLSNRALTTDAMDTESQLLIARGVARGARFAAPIPLLLVGQNAVTMFSVQQWPEISLYNIDTLARSGRVIITEKTLDVARSANLQTGITAPALDLEQYEARDTATALLRAIRLDVREARKAYGQNGAMGPLMLSQVRIIHVAFGSQSAYESMTDGARRLLKLAEEEVKKLFPDQVFFKYGYIGSDNRFHMGEDTEFSDQVDSDELHAKEVFELDDSPQADKFLGYLGYENTKRSELNRFGAVIGESMGTDDAVHGKLMPITAEHLTAVIMGDPGFNQDIVGSRLVQRYTKADKPITPEILNNMTVVPQGANLNLYRTLGLIFKSLAALPWKTILQVVRSAVTAVGSAA
jgi:hypothetical protein